MAAQHVLRLSEPIRPQHRELLGMDDVVRAVLTAPRRLADPPTGHNVRHGLAQTQVYVDSSMLYMLVDELLLWAAQLAPHRRHGRPLAPAPGACD